MKKWSWKLILGVWAAKFFVGILATWVLNPLFVLFLWRRLGGPSNSMGFVLSPLRLMPLLVIAASVDLVAGYWIATRAPARPFGHALLLTVFSIFVGLLLVNSAARYDYPAYFNLGRYLVIIFIVVGGWMGAKAREAAAAKAPKNGGSAEKPPIASPFGN